MPRPQRNGLNGRQILQRHIFRRPGQLQAGNCTGERRVGARGTVTVEIGQNVHIAGQKRDIFRFAGHFTQQRIQHFVNGLPL
ncbi:hypothetical protein D3C81_1872460 [compost metagenome]